MSVRTILPATYFNNNTGELLPSLINSSNGFQVASSSGKSDGYQQLGMFTDGRYATGKAGLRAIGAEAGFDDVIVTR